VAIARHLMAGFGNSRHVLTCVLIIAALALPGMATAQVNSPQPFSERDACNITLHEAIAMALEHSSSGLQRVETMQYPEGDDWVHDDSALAWKCTQPFNCVACPFAGSARMLLIYPAISSGNKIEGPPAGNVCARIAFDNQRADFKRSVNYLLWKLEIAYWNLHCSYMNLYCCEQGMRHAHTTGRISQAKYEAGSIAIGQVAQTREHFKHLRADRSRALDRLLEDERALRSWLGLPMEDGKRLVPVDTPTIAQHRPDWASAYASCMSLLPELIMKRNDLKLKQLEMNRANNQAVVVDTLVPLTISTQNAAVENTNTFGRHSTQRNDPESRAERYLTTCYRQVFEEYHVLEARHQQRLAAKEQHEARFKEFVTGTTTADLLLETDRDWLNAVSAENAAIIDYNNALARFEFAKGTIMQHHGITLAE
jgi:hypothetical protein